MDSDLFVTDKRETRENGELQCKHIHYVIPKEQMTFPFLQCVPYNKNYKMT